MRPDHDDASDAGAATIWVACLVVLVVAATWLAVAAATAVTTRHAAQLAADLAALAAARRIGLADDSCAAAALAAQANGAVVTGCRVEVTGVRSGEVRVVVRRSGSWAGVTLEATARARAARAGPEDRVAE